MKTLFVSALIGLTSFSISPAVNAAEPSKPVIVKINTPGHVPWEYSRKETCEIYLDKAIVTVQMGVSGASSNNEVVTFKREQTISITPNIYEMIDQAAQADLQEIGAQVCDAPSTTVFANKKNGSQVLLLRMNDCSGKSVLRDGGSSIGLRKIVDTFCSKTN